MSGMSVQKMIKCFRDIPLDVRHVSAKNDQVLREHSARCQAKSNRNRRSANDAVRRGKLRVGSGNSKICIDSLTPLIRPHCQDLDTAYTHGTKKLDRALTVGASLILYLMNLPKKLVQKAPL